MTYREAVKEFKYGEYLSLDILDRPLIRMAWNGYVDQLAREGRITERQASTWGQPKFVAQ